MPTDVHTICFHTRDAVERDDSRFVFEMPQHRIVHPSAKVSLGSCEFPMVQWTIEEEWSRLYMNEGICLRPGENCLKMVARRHDRKDPLTPAEIGVPPSLNEVVSVRFGSNGADVEFAHPHMLWSSDGTKSLIPSLVEAGCGPRLICTSEGDVPLSSLFKEGHVRFLTSTSIRVTRRDALEKASGSDAATKRILLHVPTLPSPRLVCHLLTLSSIGAQIFGEGETDEKQRVSFSYDEKRDHVVARASFGSKVVLRFLPTPLSSQLGLTTVPLTVEEGPLPSGPTRLWDYVNVETGFYAPAHRPMGTGAPLRVGNEVEAAANRLYFPLPSSPQQERALPTTPHAMVFIDHTSKTRICPIPCGRYSPSSLCSHLESEMTNVSSSLFTVFYDEGEERFVFSCEKRTRGGAVEAAPFTILFQHPLSIEASRLGFPSQPCVGGTSYSSTFKVHFPSLGSCYGGSEKKRQRNILRVSEIGSKKKLRFHSASIPTMTSLVLKREEGGVYLIRTHVNKLPFCSGLQEGDCVRVFPHEFPSSFIEANPENGSEFREMEYEGGRGFSFEVTAVVARTDARDPSVIAVYMPDVEDVGRCISIVSPVEPWNLSFSSSMEKSLDASSFGFEEKSVQYGVDGSVKSGSTYLPPFDAPFVHDFDHPDYVLLTLNESSSCSLEHSYGGESKNVFAKLVLYPLFREERMLPRDGYLQRSTFSRFEIAFFNPDMKRKYKFHGAEFSFSLNFIYPLPSSEK